MQRMRVWSYILRLLGKAPSSSTSSPTVEVSAPPAQLIAAAPTENAQAAEKLSADVASAPDQYPNAIKTELADRSTEITFQLGDSRDFEQEGDEVAADEAEPFRDFMDGIAAIGEMQWMNARIAGVTHRNADGSSRQTYIRELTFLDELRLERDPHNEHSVHAVRLLDQAGHLLGFVPDWLARDVASALDSGGTASCYVRHIRQSGATNFGVAIGVAWRIKRSPRTEFRAAIEKRTDVEEWFWAKLSRVRGDAKQSAISLLVPGEQLLLRAQGKAVQVLTESEELLACLSRQQAETVQAGLLDGRNYEAVVFEVRDRPGTQDIEPVIAVLLMKE